MKLPKVRFGVFGLASCPVCDGIYVSGAQTRCNWCGHCLERREAVARPA